MMGKNQAAVAVLAFIIASGCGANDTVENVLSDKLDAMEEFSENMEKANGPKEVIRALDTYTERVKGLVPREERFWNDIHGIDYENPPRHLRQIVMRSKRITRRYLSANFKLVHYVKDPGVDEALKRLQSSASSYADPK